MTTELLSDDNMLGEGDQRTRIKTWPSAALFTKNVTRTDRTQVSSLKGRRLIAWSMIQLGNKRWIVLMCD